MSKNEKNAFKHECDDCSVHVQRRFIARYCISIVWSAWNINISSHIISRRTIRISFNATESDFIWECHETELFYWCFIKEISVWSDQSKSIIVPFLVLMLDWDHAVSQAGGVASCQCVTVTCVWHKQAGVWGRRAKCHVSRVTRCSWPYPHTVSGDTGPAPCSGHSNKPPNLRS